MDGGHDPREQQLKSAAAKKANTPRRQLDRMVREIADKGDELSDEAIDQLDAIIRRRRTRGGQ